MKVRRHPPAVSLQGAGDRSVSDRPAGSIIEFSSPAPFFLVAYALPVCFGSTIPVFRIAATNRFAQPFQPVTRPREFDAQNREPHGNDHDGGSRCHDHHDTDQQYSDANDGNDDASGSLVRQMNHSLDQDLPHCP